MRQPKPHFLWVSRINSPDILHLARAWMGEPQEGKSRGGGRFVIAGLVSAISIRKAQRADY
jgi:hypothetical protein